MICYISKFSEVGKIITGIAEQKVSSVTLCYKGERVAEMTEAEMRAFQVRFRDMHLSTKDWTIECDDIQNGGKQIMHFYENGRFVEEFRNDFYSFNCDMALEIF